MEITHNTIVPKGNKYKNYAWVCIGCLLLLLCGAVVFYRERMLFSDAPHVLFRIINDNKLQIAEHRYGSFITQLFPLIGARLQLSLQSLALLYSISFTLFFLLAGLTLTCIYKRYDLTILLTLYLTLFVSDTYYWTNNEVHQGIAWLLLAFAVTQHLAARGYHTAIQLPVFVILFALAIWTHPLIMLPALFLWFYFWLSDRKQRSHASMPLYSAILLGLSFAKFYQGMHHGYDSGKIEIVTQLNAAGLRSVLSAPQLHTFIKGCLTNYWWAMVLFAAGTGTLLWQKKYLLATYTVASAGGYVLLLCITYRDVTGLKFYMESEYMPLTLICCAPFVYHILQYIKPRYATLLLSAILLTRLCYIQKSAKPFSDRMALMETIDRKMKDKHLTKLIITHTGTAADSELIMNWGTPIESMVLSQMNNEVPQRTFICADDQQLKTFNTASKDTLLGCFEKVPATKLNARYFKMDTGTAYTTMDFEVFMRGE